MAETVESLVRKDESLERFAAVFPELRQKALPKWDSHASHRPSTDSSSIAIKLALLNHELQQGLSHTSDALLQTQLEEEVAEQRIEFICPISLIAGSDKAPDLDALPMHVMRDPVTAADGVTYERAHIEDWITRQLSTTNKAASSPLFNTPLQHTDLQPNSQLKADMRRAVQDQRARGQTREQRLRTQHAETLRAKALQAEAEVQQEREREREWLRMQARSDREFLETLRRDRVRLVCKQGLSWVQVQGLEFRV